MKPGERVTLIKKIGAGMADWDYADIDLTLDQFGLATLNDWTGDAYGYVIHLIGGATDETLVGLHDHVHPGEAFGVSAAGEGEEPASRPLRPFRLFLTHVHQHQTFMAELRDALEEYGITAFVAHVDIEPTREWEQVIETELRGCDALAAYLTPGFAESKWADQEIGFAVGRAILVVPIKSGPDPYGFIGKYQAIQGAGKPADVLAGELQAQLRDHPETKQRMAEAAVEHWAVATSFEQARDRYGVVRAIPRDMWTPAMRRPGEGSGL